MIALLSLEDIEAKFQELPDDVKREVIVCTEHLNRTFTNMPKEGFEGASFLIATNYVLAVTDAFHRGHDTAMKMVVETLKAKPNSLARDVAKFLVEQGALNAASFGQDGAG